jgi:predicted nucleic acid-binding protein
MKFYHEVFYLDTSVFGGLFDKEFQEPTRKLFKFIKDNNVKLLYSDIIEEELELAPQAVKLVASQLLINSLYIARTDEMTNLSQVYLKEGALTAKSANDALHIAIATISGATAVISWNFKHMVNFIRIRQYNSINLREGYGLINIHTPQEIPEY